MTDIVKLVNDVSKYYEEGLIEEENGTFTCPVCKKNYTRKRFAEKHIAKENCYRVQDLFGGTEYEKHALIFFQSMMAILNPRARIIMSNFRKSKSYGQVVRFILFTAYHDVLDKGLYYSWLSDVVGLKHPSTILSEATKEVRLREFRKFLQANPELVDSETFVDQHIDDLIEDQQFFIRSIEKGKVTIDYLSKRKDFPFDEVCGNLYQDYYNRLLDMT